MGDRTSNNNMRGPNKQGKKMSIKLESSDEQVFEVPREVAEMSLTIKNMLADIDSSSTDSIPLSITGNILAKVSSACTTSAEVQWRHYVDRSPFMQDFAFYTRFSSILINLFKLYTR
jgi:hypothetical protein